MNNIKALFLRKVGPLPMGAWIVVLAGGMLIAYFINRRGGFGNRGSSSIGDTSEDDSDSGFSDDDDSGEDITGGLLNTQGSLTNPSLGGVVIVNPNPGSGAKPSLPPIPGTPVNPRSTTTLVKPKPSSKSGQKPPANSPSGGHDRIYAVKSGDNLWNLAQRFYGDGNKWRKILNANPKIKSDNKYGYMIYSGTTLRIP